MAGMAQQRTRTKTATHSIEKSFAVTPVKTPENAAVERLTPEHG
jgi:hypothetical protein